MLDVGYIWAVSLYFALERGDTLLVSLLLPVFFLPITWCITLKLRSMMSDLSIRAPGFNILGRNAHFGPPKLWNVCSKETSQQRKPNGANHVCDVLTTRNPKKRNHSWPMSNTLCQCSLADHRRPFFLGGRCAQLATETESTNPLSPKWMHLFVHFKFSSVISMEYSFKKDLCSFQFDSFYRCLFPKKSVSAEFFVFEIPNLLPGFAKAQLTSNLWSCERWRLESSPFNLKKNQCLHVSVNLWSGLCWSSYVW